MQLYEILENSSEFELKDAVDILEYLRDIFINYLGDDAHTPLPFYISLLQKVVMINNLLLRSYIINSIVASYDRCPRDAKRRFSTHARVCFLAEL